MEETEDKILALQTRLDKLVKTQISFQQEITQIRNELNRMREVEQRQLASEQARKPPVREYVPPARNDPPPVEQPTSQTKNRESAPTNQAHSPNQNPRPADIVRNFPQPPKEKSEIEKFIGENLISKIGIVILVIGVAIFAKYVIDKNLISPLARIVLGYLFGFGLLGLAFKLKAKYLNFSAVLLSGALAILYFITFFAHSIYELISQSTAFAMMTILTVFTVAAAVNFSRQIIAHFGLVGAYAVPFLLSNNSGDYPFLFAYVAIINTGILAVSLKKYWKPLFYTSFMFTWAIFYGWYLTAYQTNVHFSLAFAFLFVYFLIFYITFVGYKVVNDENIAAENVSLILINSSIFYGIGYSLLDNEALTDFRGLFTVANAAIHFAFAAVISRLKLFPNDLVYLLTALVITFATIAIPVQLDGNFVTLLWTAEAAFLFWIGRTKQIALFQYSAFPLMFLAGLGLAYDWFEVAQTRSFDQIDVRPLLNGNFVTSLIFAAAFGFIFLVNKDERFETAIDEAFRKSFGYVAAAVALGVFYNAFRIEISNYFHSLSVQTAISETLSTTDVKDSNRDLDLFSAVWQINYTMLFLALLSFINIRRFKNFVLGYANIFLNTFALFLFLTAGLFLLSELRESYLRFSEPQVFASGSFHIMLRYISYAFVAGLLLACYRYLKQEFMLEKLSSYALGLAFDIVFYTTLWLIFSSELLNLTDIFGYQDSYKLGLSILWGVFALGLIVLGIYGHKKHLRIGAIGLFALTLLKVFFYDIAELNTISKTIVFVSLGILMLIVSFLYNKYKSLIFNTETE